MQQLSEENARALLNVVEQRRQHSSTAISALNGLAITLVVGIWTYFLKSFLDTSSAINPTGSPEPSQPFAFSYVVVAAGLSTIVLALWRFYARYLDDEIAKTYPEIMQYEQILGVGSDAGILNHISSQRAIREIVPELSLAQRRQLMRQLVEDKHIGRRGHGWIDFGVFLLFSFFTLVILFEIYIQWRNQLLSELVNEIFNNPLLALRFVGYSLMVAGWAILIYQIRHFQQNPHRPYVRRIADRITAESQDMFRRN